MFQLHPWLNHLFTNLGMPTARLAPAETTPSPDADASAFPLFALPARLGRPEPPYGLRRGYRLGIELPSRIREVLGWLRGAVEPGQTAAQTRRVAPGQATIDDDRATVRFDEPRQETDVDRAEYWCRQAVAAGSTDAKALFGFILAAGPRSRREAAQLYREATQQGWSRDRLGLAIMLMHKADPKNSAQAVDLLRSAAADGVAVAHHLLGMLAESGAAGPVDFAAAACSYKAAAELGHAASQVRYGFSLLLGRGSEPDAFKAETWFRRAALLGDAQASAVVSYLYGGDADRSPTCAASSGWLQRTADASHAGAARTLGRMLLLGAGVPKNIQEAAHWLRIAGDHGDETARADMVRLALTRQVGEADQRAVIGWLQHAAAAGDPAAQLDLGLCLTQGIGTEQDNLTAYVWAFKAAQGGHPEARRILAQIAEQV